MATSTRRFTGQSLFEISIRPWLLELSQKHKSKITKLKDIPNSELEQIAADGFDYVWFMGVWKVGAFGLNRDRTDPSLLEGYAHILPGFTEADILGSPYAVVEYTCNPEIGTDDDLRALRERLHKLGLRLMLDFVPNHLAVDNPLLEKGEKDLFVQAPKDASPPYDKDLYLPSGVAYGRDRFSGAWPDTAQINYFNEKSIAMSFANLDHVASLADGIRCDMAMLVVNDVFKETWSWQLESNGWQAPKEEFWSFAITDIKKRRPDVIFMAEVYWDMEAHMHWLGFDYTYDKALLDKLETYHLDNIRGYITGRDKIYHQKSAHFIENHDEKRGLAAFGNSPERTLTAAVIVLTLPGLRFIFQGQKEGFGCKLDVHLARSAPEPVRTEMQQYYVKLLDIIKARVFKEGEWTYLPVTNSDVSWRLMAWKWTLEGEQSRLIVINFSDELGGGAVVLSDAKGNDDKVTVTELITGVTYDRKPSELTTSGLFLVLEPWTAQIFAY